MSENRGWKGSCEQHQWMACVGAEEQGLKRPQGQPDANPTTRASPFPPQLSLLQPLLLAGLLAVLSHSPKTTSHNGPG